jgi:hypothetical protein
MGADAFIGFYGIEEVVPADSDITALEARSADRIVRARWAKLDTWFGRVTDGAITFYLSERNSRTSVWKALRSA